MKFFESPRCAKTQRGDFCLTALQKATYDPDARFSLENALRQALTGAAFGATVSSLDSLVSSAKKDGFLAGFYEKEIKDADNRDSGNNILIKEDENSLLKEKAATQENSRTKIDSGTKYDYNDDGTVIVTDDWTTISHPNIARFYKENAVIDTSSRSGQRDRIFYDDQKRQTKQIHSGPHSNAKWHPYGVHGEHAHDIIWEGDKIVDRTTRELTDYERKENADIL